MKEFFNKHKGVILPLILIAVFAFGVAVTWGKWGHIIYDCFREAVIPQAILDGNVLYRDITNLYPPSGYYFNSLLYLIFGNSLNTLYWAGIINSFLILSIIYFIVKKYSSDLTAFITVLSIMEIFTFKISASNTTASWFFPYSYSFIYAFVACLISLLFYVLYKDKIKPLYLYLSFLFTGLSIAFKLDFILFALIPAYGLIKRKSFKDFLISTACLFTPFIISILIYLSTGGTLLDLQNEIGFLIDFSHAPSVIAFNKGLMPQAFYPSVLSKVFTSFKYFIFESIVIFLYILFSLFVITLSAMLISYRSFALLYLANIGNFMLAVWWIAFVYLFLELIPKYFPNILKKEILKKTLALFFVIYPLYFVFLYAFNAKQMTHKITGNKGVFYGSSKFMPVINETIKFINEEISEGKTLLAAEEGVVFNYLTGRKTDLKYYALIPHMVDTYGEENIIHDLAKEPPDYFLITNSIYITEKLGGVFGVHYAKKIIEFILYNYDYVKTIKNPDIKEGLEITVFKLK